jgi:hypothetical protein
LSYYMQSYYYSCFRYYRGFSGREGVEPVITPVGKLRFVLLTMNTETGNSSQRRLARSILSKYITNEVLTVPPPSANGVNGFVGQRTKTSYGIMP